MNKKLKILFLIPIAFILVLEILPFNALIITQFPVYGTDDVFRYYETEAEYCSYFDISVFGRGNIFAFPAGIFTALSCISACIGIFADRLKFVKIAMILSACAVVFQFAQIWVFGSEFLKYCATNTGVLLCAATTLFSLWWNLSRPSKTNENFSEKEKSL